MFYLKVHQCDRDYLYFILKLSGTGNYQRMLKAGVYFEASECEGCKNNSATGERKQTANGALSGKEL